MRMAGVNLLEGNNRVCSNPLLNDLMASVQRDASTSANVISGLFSRHSNVILGKPKDMKPNRTGHCQCQT